MGVGKTQGIGSGLALLPFHRTPTAHTWSQTPPITWADHLLASQTLQGIGLNSGKREYLCVCARARVSMLEQDASLLSPCVYTHAKPTCTRMGLQRMYTPVCIYGPELGKSPNYWGKPGEEEPVFVRGCFAGNSL